MALITRISWLSARAPDIRALAVMVRVAASRATVRTVASRALAVVIRVAET